MKTKFRNMSGPIESIDGSVRIAFSYKREGRTDQEIISELTGINYAVFRSLDNTLRVASW